MGLVFPTREIEPSPTAIRSWGEMAAKTGADYITISDHILGVDPSQQGAEWGRNWPHSTKFKRPYNHEDRFHEAFVTMGFLAAVCPLELSTGVLVLPQRNTALVAKQAAQVDLLSGGKLRLGVGVGWNKTEFAAVGEEFHDRGRRIEEQIALMRQYWTHPLVNFEGQFHKVHAAGLAPMPVQQPIPVWIGGAGLDKGVEPVARLLRRIGTVADGWCLNAAINPSEVVAEAISLVRKTAAEHGRNPDHLGFDKRLIVANVDKAELVRRVQGFARAGGTHITIETNGLGLSSAPQSTTELTELVGFIRSAAEGA
jgi:probable F420-dependent oxidoreductase